MAVGAKTIITACPFCVSNLIFGSEDKDVKVIDLMEIVDELL